MSTPEALVVAGPNGSGKSTILQVLPPQGIVVPGVVINPDDIARRLRQEHPGLSARDVNRKAFEEGRSLRREYREGRLSFTLESVFSHPSGLIDLKLLRQAGYRITLAVVTTGDPEVNVRRVAGRVKAGGHSVEEDKIRSRHGRFLRLLPRIVEAADRVFVFDTTGPEVRLCYQRNRFVVERDMPDYLRSALLEPLTARAACRADIEAQRPEGEEYAYADEASGRYEGRMRTCASHYALQEVGPGRCVLHDLLLAGPTPVVGEIVRVSYKDGEGTVEGGVAPPGI